LRPTQTAGHQNPLAFFKVAVASPKKVNKDDAGKIHIGGQTLFAFVRAGFVNSLSDSQSDHIPED
jgi:hypothetical protein